MRTICLKEDEAIDHSEVRRLEKLLPGTDREEEPEEVPGPRRPRPQDPPPPDTDPQELAGAITRDWAGPGCGYWLCSSSLPSPWSNCWYPPWDLYGSPLWTTCPSSVGSP